MLSLRFVIAAIFAALVPAVFAFGLLASVRIVHNSPTLAGTLPRPQLAEIQDWKQYYMQASLRVSEPDVAETRRSDEHIVVAPALFPSAVVSPAVIASAVVAPVLIPSEFDVPAAPPVEERVVSAPPAIAPAPVRAEEDVPRVDQVVRLPVVPAEPPAAESEETPPTKAGKHTRAERRATAKIARAERIEKLREKRRTAAAARRQPAPVLLPDPFAPPAPFPQ